MGGGPIPVTRWMATLRELPADVAAERILSRVAGRGTGPASDSREFWGIRAAGPMGDGRWPGMRAAQWPLAGRLDGKPTNRRGDR